MPRKKILMALVLLACVSRLPALEPPTPAQIRQYTLDGSMSWRLQNAYALGNHLVASELAWNFARRLRQTGLRTANLPGADDAFTGLPPGTTNVLKSQGTVKIFALLISFPDYPFISSSQTITSKLFGDGDGGFPYESLRNYYRRASYNQLEIQGNVVGWYTPVYLRTSVSMTTSGRENLIKEALRAIDAQGHDFSQYDNDSDGKIDYFVVIWTGPNNGWANFWWGYQTSFSSSFSLDGKSFNGTRYSWQWELRSYPSGSYDQVVVMHETGHALGLPDYYDYDASVGPQGGVGGLDMMDGTWGDHNAFSKTLLDWIAPQSFNYGSRPSSLGASGNTRDALILMPEFAPAQPFDEFYIVQNRFRVQNDTPFPNDGLLVWHVDARLTGGGSFLYNNSYTEHKLLRLMEADGLERIESGARADAGDYYVQGREFTPTTAPDSRRYDATDSGVSIFGIGSSGQTMSFAADIHHTLPAPQSVQVQRQTFDYIFFRICTDTLTWQPSSRNHTRIVKYLVYRKPKTAGEDAFVLLAEIPAEGHPNGFTFQQTNIPYDSTFTYRLISVDLFGATSEPADVSNQ
jgi:M6 family metalloprotease-like protein